MSKKMLFLYNPKSGKAQIKSRLADILDIFVKGGYELTVHPTQCKGDAVEKTAHRSPDYDMVVCSGGDGTLDEVMNGMMQSGFFTPVGYIPSGSTNDFGGSLGLPKNMLQAAEAIVRGKDFPCDIGVFNQEVFVYIAAFGLFTEVSYETKQDMKNVLGHMAYVLEGIKRISSVHSYIMKISYEEGEIEDEFIYGMITNSLSVGGFKNITGKNVKLDDGMFEVILIKKPKNPLELNNIILALLNKNFDSESMYYFRTKRLVCQSDVLVAWTLDGENGGSHKKVIIENRYRAATIRVPDEMK